MTEKYENAIEEAAFEVFGREDMAAVARSILQEIEYKDFDDRNESSVVQAVRDGLYWDDDEWTVLRYYCSPEDANWDAALESLYNDMLEAYNKVCEILEED